jgi:hypothetical protein
MTAYTRWSSKTTNPYKLFRGVVTQSREVAKNENVPVDLLCVFAALRERHPRKKSWNKPPGPPDISNVTGSSSSAGGISMKDKPLAKPASIRSNWLFEVEPYSRTQNETLADLRDNLRLKKVLKRAVEREVAPLSLIQSIRDGIRA